MKELGVGWMRACVRVDWLVIGWCCIFILGRICSDIVFTGSLSEPVNNNTAFIGTMKSHNYSSLMKPLIPCHDTLLVKSRKP